MCFDETEHRINCAPLTILVGPNNSGKSAMLTAFNLLRQFGLTGHPSNWTTESYNLNDFQTAVHNHDNRRSIELGTDISESGVTINFSISVSESAWSGLRVNSARATSANLFRTAWYFRASRSDITRDRPTGSGASIPTWGQPLDPSGSNIITYLLERWTDQDKKWPVAQEWLKRVDPELEILKSPLRGNMASLETTNRYSDVSVNLAYQGTGIQKALTIIAGVIFSPPNATIIIEEPEVHLERGSIETLVDLFNYAVNHWNKQIILSTHSIDLLLQYASEVGLGTKRGGQHEHLDASKFNLVTFERKEGKIQIEDQDMKGRFSTMMERLKSILKPETVAKVTA